MGKSIRSKVKKQFRTIKRESLDEKERVRLEKIVTKLEDAAAPGTGLPVLPRRQQIIVMETDDEPANSKRNTAHRSSVHQSWRRPLCVSRTGSRLCRARARWRTIYIVCDGGRHCDKGEEDHCQEGQAQETDKPGTVKKQGSAAPQVLDPPLFEERTVVASPSPWKCYAWPIWPASSPDSCEPRRRDRNNRHYPSQRLRPSPTQLRPQGTASSPCRSCTCHYCRWGTDKSVQSVVFLWSSGVASEARCCAQCLTLD